MYRYRKTSKFCCFADFSNLGVNHGIEIFIRWKSLPIFVGQLISAYEGIGCVRPYSHYKTWKLLVKSDHIGVVVADHSD